jgi:hypothetical protein
LIRDATPSLPLANMALAGCGKSRHDWPDIG